MVLAPAVAVVVLLGACSQGRPGTTDSSGAVAARDPDVVVSVYTTGAQGDPGTRVPDFEMRRDGTVYLNGGDPFGIDRYRLTAEGIGTVDDLAARVRPDADYGELDWTDLSTTSVYLNLDGRPVGVSVYGLRAGSDPETLTGLTGDQINARRELLAVLAELTELSERADQRDALVAEPREAYLPETIELMLLPVAVDPDATTAETPGEEPVAWPLAGPLTDRSLGFNGSALCTVVEADDARAVAGLVSQPGAQPRPWATGAEPDSGAPVILQVWVQGLLPGDDGLCREGAQPDRLSISPLSEVVLADPAEWEGGLAADRFEPASALDAYAVAAVLDAGMTGYRDTLDAGGACEFDADFDYPPGTCHIDGRLQPVPDLLRMPTGASLTYYDYRLVAAVVDGARYLDLEARSVWPAESREAWQTEAASWRARIDPATGAVTAVELDR